MNRKIEVLLLYSLYDIIHPSALYYMMLESDATQIVPVYRNVNLDNLSKKDFSNYFFRLMHRTLCVKFE